MMNLNHKNVVFVPGCLLAPVFQAGDGEKNWAWAQEWIEFLGKSSYNIVQMVCPESTFDTAECGLGRRPHGVGFYENLPGFCQHCLLLSAETAKSILDFVRNGYHVVAILGVEHSPTCATSYMYTNQGMQKRSGIFMGNIIKTLSRAGISVPMIGINRRYPKKSIARLTELMDNI